MASFQLQLLICFFCSVLLQLNNCSNWDYQDTDAWSDDYAFCGGEGESPIDVQLSALDRKCPSTIDQNALLWELDSTKTANFLLENNGHTLEMFPIKDILDNNVLDESSDTIGILRNNFVTDSNEHSNYCLESFHIHFGDSKNNGAEHRFDGKQYATEVHFVHFSCDYPDIASARADTTVSDTFVLAVVAVIFEIGDANPFIDHIITKMDNIKDAEGTMDITMANVVDLVPSCTTDFIYYEGSLTTPSCDPIVRWHILAHTMTISNEQLEKLRLMDNSEGDDLAPNYREAQDNGNTVYYCSDDSEEETLFFSGDITIGQNHVNSFVAGGGGDGLKELELVWEKENAELSHRNANGHDNKKGVHDGHGWKGVEPLNVLMILVFALWCVGSCVYFRCIRLGIYRCYDIVLCNKKRADLKYIPTEIDSDVSDHDEVVGINKVQESEIDVL